MYVPFFFRKPFNLWGNGLLLVLIIHVRSTCYSFSFFLLLRYSLNIFFTWKFSSDRSRPCCWAEESCLARLPSISTREKWGGCGQGVKHLARSVIFLCSQRYNMHSHFPSRRCPNQQSLNSFPDFCHSSSTLFCVSAVSIHLRPSVEHYII